MESDHNHLPEALVYDNLGLTCNNLPEELLKLDSVALTYKTSSDKDAFMIYSN